MLHFMKNYSSRNVLPETEDDLSLLHPRRAVAQVDSLADTMEAKSSQSFGNRCWVGVEQGNKRCSGRGGIQFPRSHLSIRNIIGCKPILNEMEKATIRASSVDVHV